ncbi:MAG: hypothetical protein WCR67_03725 [Bacilli bacterium]
MFEQNSERMLVVSNGLDLVASFSAIGAGIKSLTYKGQPVILEPADIETYFNSSHLYGKTLGRVAGRIKNNFVVHGKPCKVADNENGQNICLHGDCQNSLSFKKFDVFVANKPEGNYVIFTYTSPDGEAGFYGNVDFKITYFLPFDRNEIIVRQKALSDMDTPISLSTHMYFNLGNDENVNDYTLQVNASKYGSFKKGTKLINGIVKVPSYLDYRQESRLGDKLDELKEAIPEYETFDHFLKFNTTDSTIPQITLSNGKIKLEVLTDYEGANFYVDTSMSEEEFTNAPHLRYRRAIAIEPQRSLYPFDEVVENAGMRYSYFATYRFSDVK